MFISDQQAPVKRREPGEPSIIMDASAGLSMTTAGHNYRGDLDPESLLMGLPHLARQLM